MPASPEFEYRVQKVEVAAPNRDVDGALAAVLETWAEGGWAIYQVDRIGFRGDGPLVCRLYARRRKEGAPDAK